MMKEIARDLSSRGYDLVLVSRGKAAMAELKTELERARHDAVSIAGGEGGAEIKPLKCHILQYDLANASAPQRIFDEVKRLGLEIDMLVSNAGVCYMGKFVEQPLGVLDDHLHINMLAHTKLMHIFSTDMATRKRGRILLISSVTSASPNPGVAAYAASKAYLSSLGLALHTELAPLGITVTTAMPGAVHTEFSRTAGAQNSLCFRFPGYAKLAPEVARSAVDATVRGDMAVVYGVVNKAWAHLVSPLLPLYFRTQTVRLMWSTASGRRGARLDKVSGGPAPVGGRPEADGARNEKEEEEAVAAEEAQQTQQEEEGGSETPSEVDEGTDQPEAAEGNDDGAKVFH